MTWTEDEIGVLTDNWPEHMGSWKGWARILPGREPYQIDAKGASLMRRGKLPSDVPDTDGPIEGAVMRAMHSGLAPSTIDVLMGWADGEARKKCVRFWEKDTARAALWLMEPC